MKRTLSALLTLLMIVCLAASAVSAADAADGDLLYTADFSDAGFKVLGVNDGFIYEAIEGGAGVTMYSKADNTEDKNNVWGIYLDDLGVQNGEKYTLTYKVRANGEIGKNNSVGLGMVTSGATDEGGPCVYNFYSNHNTITAEGSLDERRGTFSHGGSKMTDYGYEIKDADEDNDLFITIKQEIDTAAKTVKAYTLIVDKWVFLQEQPIEITADSKACVMFRLHYAVIDSTFKDVKIFKGIGLTDEQLAGPVVEEVADDVAAAPQTFDMGVIAAAAAVVSAAGYAVSKKR